MENSISILEKERKKIKESYERKKMFFKSTIRMLFMFIVAFSSAYITHFFNFCDSSTSEIIFFIFWIEIFGVTLFAVNKCDNKFVKIGLLCIYPVINGINVSTLYENDLKKIVISFAIVFGILGFLSCFKNAKKISFVGLIFIIGLIAYFVITNINYNFVMFCILCFMLFFLIMGFNNLVKDENYNHLNDKELQFTFAKFVLLISIISNLIEIL